ncbi:hypothetical protein Nepgr_033363 [Nepenthes gracilis]|uniref:Uncharacterized protein n=1 Tax=Nepenthes gracilis TaxID=150966 RepID=A0AAD3TKC8_NEPGR|nr:hypothetical protein Nepgr_033363 [Nepenthes gracilis]
MKSFGLPWAMIEEAPVVDNCTAAVQKLESQLILSEVQKKTTISGMGKEKGYCPGDSVWSENSMTTCNRNISTLDHDDDQDFGVSWGMIMMIIIVEHDDQTVGKLRDQNS